MYIHIFVCICAYICIYIYVCTHKHTHTHTHTRIYHISNIITPPFPPPSLSYICKEYLDGLSWSQTCKDLVIFYFFIFWLFFIFYFLFFILYYICKEYLDGLSWWQSCKEPPPLFLRASLLLPEVSACTMNAETSTHHDVLAPIYIHAYIA